MRNKKPLLALVISAVVLLALAFFLSRGSAEASSADAGPAPKEPSKKVAVTFPRDRMNDPHRKPVVLAQGQSGAVFIEANAIRHAPLVEAMLKCREKENHGGLEEMKQKLGIDPMEDVDRVGFDGKVFVASGFFAKLKVPEELGAPAVYGDKGKVWSTVDDKGQRAYFGQLGDDMVLTAGSEDELHAAMDRASGKTPVQTPDLPAGFGEGEIYGSVGASFIQSLFSESSDPMTQSLGKLLTSSTVRADVDQDAAFSMDLQAIDDKAGGDLSDAMKGVLAGLHAKAEKDGDDDLANLLEQARVSPSADGHFSLDVALPGETILRGMGCNADGTPIAAAPSLAPPPPGGPANNGLTLPPPSLPMPRGH
jgi:hypothetical protein